MKVITVIQPWATLLALGEKKFETRSWATKYRGELGIHAGKKIDKVACRRESMRSVLEKHGYNETNLPTGVILATSHLQHCYRIRRPSGEHGVVILDRDDKSIGWAGRMPKEYHFGDYSEGRFAWELVNAKPLPHPIPAKGQLGLWSYPIMGM